MFARQAWDKNGALTNFSSHPIRVPSGANGEEPGQRLWPSVEHYYQAQKLGGDSASCADALALIDAIATARSPEEAARIGRRAERERPELMVADWQSRKVEAMKQALLAKYTTHEGPRRMLMASAECAVGECASGFMDNLNPGLLFPFHLARSSRILLPSVALTASPEGFAIDYYGNDALIRRFCRYQVVEAAPHDFFWGCGTDGRGFNKLGRLLMELRDWLLGTAPPPDGIVCDNIDIKQYR